MEFRPLSCAAAVAAVVLTIAEVIPTPALAHERRAVGPYSFIVGFNTEPAIQGQPNGAQLTVTVPGEENRPVEGLADSLRATVAFGGGQPKELKLRPVFSHPGQYVADFIPTRSGTYIFHFTGNVESEPIDEEFESGPGRFNDVQSVEALQFPDQIPLGNDVARSARQAAEAAAAAQSDAGAARSLAVVGVALGATGLVVAAAAVIGLLARRPAHAAPVEGSPEHS
ncbi:MAG TPA: hypothetical protein VFC51_02050 [Chloroflexota bacterium]|nr:hypothetical protein [Chloroflexota bacterium]